VARESVVLQALDRRTLVVEGSDRRAWLNGVITQEAPSQARGAYGLALSRPGKIQGDVYCLEIGDAILVATKGSVHEALLTQWQRMLVMEEVELADASPAWQWWLAIGPESDSVAPSGAEAGELDVLGLGGRLFAVPTKTPALDFPVSKLAPEDWLELRLERRFPEFGVDYTDLDRPHEAGLDRLAVSWTKGCYLGQEVVCMQEMRGKVKRRLELLVADAPFLVVPDADVAIRDASGEVVGQVTSAVNGRRLGIGLVMAKLAVAAREGALSLASGESLRVSEPL
jgi:folate-binding protein YgfZ